MEVFVAILLLFGAFSIGFATSDDADDDPAGVEISTAVNVKQDLPGKGAEAGGVEHTQLPDCLADRHFVIYRDLTAAYKNKNETATIGASDSEEAYPDE
ncbi:hypothetical protein [Solemya velum gill symbiont]|uniref:hypothetical protein n=1 Tax=Solemya velum gill symbiont TaxID=2340 RepID=UPI00117B644D|nr:hypothetical protein [Solemya velum gill symbiont]